MEALAQHGGAGRGQPLFCLARPLVGGTFWRAAGKFGILEAQYPFPDFKIFFHYDGSDLKVRRDSWQLNERAAVSADLGQRRMFEN
jgi:hypothetical protein